jgi:orotate phosphoribosyltransferase
MTPEVQNLLNGVVPDHPLTSSEIQDCLIATDAVWIYDGELRKEAPHALLTSGKHSDGFVDVSCVIKRYPDFRLILAHTLLSRLHEVYELEGNEYVVGADTSSTDLAFDVADLAGLIHLRMQKVDDGKEKKQIWHPENAIFSGYTEILQVEELVTTATSALAVRLGIRQANPDHQVFYSPYLLTIVNRSDPSEPVDSVEESEVLSLVRLEIRNFEPDNCPYCTVGSVAIPPKKDNNWAIITCR